jgi:hypothetical protein
MEQLFHHPDVAWLQRAEIAFNLECCLRQLGRETEAQEWDRKARELNPKVGQ